MLRTAWATLALAATVFGCKSDELRVPDGPCPGAICVGQPNDAGNDPACNAVTCDAPPSQCHQAIGTCTNGVCGYELVEGQACNDGQACTEADACVSGTCMGSPIQCAAPPAPSCDGPDTSVVFDPQGSCSLGDCEYAENRISCPGECGSEEPGLCPNPCATQQCDQPPTTCYASPGDCVPETGACVYTVDPNIASCDDGDLCTTVDTCEADGACRGTGTVCDQLPAAECMGNTRRVYTLDGAMCAAQTGDCEYPFTDEACPAGCMNGACEGNCDETSCQPWSLPATPNGTAQRTCTDASCPTTRTLPNLDRNYFVCWVQPVLDQACANLGCHGLSATQRRLQLYSRYYSRLAPLVSGTNEDGPQNVSICSYVENGTDGLSPAEIDWNFDLSRIFALEAQMAQNNELVTQPLAADPLGHAHDNFDLFATTTDVRYGTIINWLGGATEAANCSGATLPVPGNLPAATLNVY